MNSSNPFGARRSQVYFRAGILFYILFSLFTLTLPFYGDHVSLISAPANFIYDSGFHTFILPDELNTGHPPFFALLHAASWAVFGRSLIVSHLLTLCTTLLLYVQFVAFAKKILNEKQLPIAILLFITQPVLITQISLMSTDILLCGLFLLGLNSIYRGNKKMLVLAIAISLLISVRGVMVSGFLFLCEIILMTQSRKRFFRTAILYLIAALPAVCWYLYHYAQTGWMLANPHSQWAAGRGLVSLKYLPGKIFEYALRYIEFGMILPWLLLIISIRKLWRSEIDRPNLKILISGLIFYSLFIVFFKNPVMLRYLLPVQLICLVVAVKCITNIKQTTVRRFLIACVVFLFTIHHFFAYPQMQTSIFEYSWGEGSLAHLSYFKFREQGKEFLNAHHIEVSEVYTGFPDYKSFQNTDLKGAIEQYEAIITDSIQSYPYIFYSNIMNGITKETELELKGNWVRLKTYYNYPVEYILFKNPKTIKNP